MPERTAASPHRGDDGAESDEGGDTEPVSRGAGERRQRGRLTVEQEEAASLHHARAILPEEDEIRMKTD